MYGSSGCVGGCAKPPPLATTEKAPHRKHRGSKRRIRGHAARPSRDWWTSSSNEMDNESVLSSRSQRNSSLGGGTNFTHDSRAAAHSNNNANNTAFVNHALMLWNEQRQEWVGNRPRHRPVQPREPVISWSTTYEDLLATSRPFPQPVPLTEMVDFLVDVWEQEGLYE